MSVSQTQQDSTMSPRELADVIDRALVEDGLQDEWTLTEVQEILESTGDTPDPEAIIAAFGVLDGGGWWYRAGNGKLICTFREVGPSTGVKPD